MILAGPFLTLALVLAAMPAQDLAQATPAAVARRDLVFLAENRPVIVRLEINGNDRPFEASWMDSIRSFHKTLDRDGDGKLTTKEADRAILTALAQLAASGAEPIVIGEIDVNPKDEVVSLDELADVLRPILGSFRLQVGRQAIGRTDALFDQLDRNKDSTLTRPELAAIAGTLRPLDLDDNDMISAEELEPFNNPAVMAQAQVSNERKARLTTLPPVVELIPGESSLRLARLLLKKYDKGQGDVPVRPDNKLSPTEFAIDPDAFAGADTNGDGALGSEELRRFLARSPKDLILDVAFPPNTLGRATVRVADPR